MLSLIKKLLTLESTFTTLTCILKDAKLSMKLCRDSSPMLRLESTRKVSSTRRQQFQKFRTLASWQKIGILQTIKPLLSPSGMLMMSRTTLSEFILPSLSLFTRLNTLQSRQALKFSALTTSNKPASLLSQV